MAKSWTSRRILETCRAPTRSQEYLNFIRYQPCLVCVIRIQRQETRTEASHTGPHGLGQKSSDLTAIPLCAGHHRTARDGYHQMGPVRFQEHHGFSIPEAIERLNTMFDARKGEHYAP